jgi:hypothetical protein
MSATQQLALAMHILVLEITLGAATMVQYCTMLVSTNSNPLNAPVC